MGVQFGICMSVVQPVHHGIGSRAHIRRALCDIGKDEEETLPALTHGEGAMGSIPVLEKRL